ncbi:hypothetical protein [Paenibacillus sp. GCM10012306]|uniref:hypothetical protein n=1 Tax=Paenibacillus sp. GCM10012306 TaxID=3317342 RepID=UPI003619B68F
MKLYKKIDYRLSKKDTPLVVTERIGQAFHDAAFDPQDIKFFVDGFTHGVSGIDRLLKHNPTLVPFCHTAETSLGHEKRLTNLPARWDGANPDGCNVSLQMQDVIEIVSGIPRRYRLNHATFVFDRLSMLSRSPDSAKVAPIPFVAKGDVGYTRLFAPRITGWSDYPSPCIRLQSDWRISGRINFLDAIVELGDITDSAPQLELNESERRFLETIGEIYHERVFCAPSTEEEAAAVFENMIAGERIVQSCYEEGNLVGVQFPYQLKPLRIEDVPSEPLSVKKAINHFFKQRGFIYNTKYSGSGIFTTTKVTKHNHLVKLTFSRGKFDANVSCVGSIEGPLWRHEFKLPSSADYMRPHGVTRQIDVDHQIGNIAAAYDAAKKRIVEAIDDLYGAEPTWLTYL